MLRCLTTQYSSHVAYWSVRPGPRHIDQARSVHILPFHRLKRQERPLALGRLLLTRTPYPTAQFMSGPACAQLTRVVTETKPDVVVLSCVELGVTLPLLRKLSRAKLVVDVHDLQGERYRTILRTLPRSDVLGRLKHLLAMRSCSIIEHDLYRDADLAWVLKQEDAHELTSYASVPKVDVVPNVIDPDAVPASLNFDEAASQGSPSAVYLGNYSGAPNEQCALRLMDLFRQPMVQECGVKLNLLGIHPTAAMKRHAANMNNVTILGEVERLADHLRPVDTIFVAPLVSGGGVKRKVIEGMMHGCPMLTTPVGAEGLELTSGENAIVTGAHEMEAPLLKLMRDRSERVRLARSGYQHIAQRFGYERLVKSVATSIDALLG
ncbi:MAG: glycosyltransferase family 4 protein [Polyangiaceae bacterium]